MPYSILITLFMIEFALIGPISTSFVLITKQAVIINALASTVFPLLPPLHPHHNTPLLHRPVIHASLNYIFIYHLTIWTSIPFTSMPAAVVIIILVLIVL